MPLHTSWNCWLTFTVPVGFLSPHVIGMFKLGETVVKSRRAVGIPLRFQIARSKLDGAKGLPVRVCLVRGRERRRLCQVCLLRVGRHDVRRAEDDDQRNQHSHVDPPRGFYLATAVAFRLVLCPRLGNRLPLHVAGGVGSAALERHDVIDHVSWTTMRIAGLPQELCACRRVS